MIVYEFKFSSCKYESAYKTVSIHKTLVGAYKAMNSFLLARYNEWYEERIKYGKDREVSWRPNDLRCEAWTISKTNVLD